MCKREREGEERGTLSEGPDRTQTEISSSSGTEALAPRPSRLRSCPPSLDRAPRVAPSRCPKSLGPRPKEFLFGSRTKEAPRVLGQDPETPRPGTTTRQSPEETPTALQAGPVRVQAPLTTPPPRKAGRTQPPGNSQRQLIYLRPFIIVQVGTLER